MVSMFFHWLVLCGFQTETAPNDKPQLSVLCIDKLNFQFSVEFGLKTAPNHTMLTLAKMFILKRKQLIQQFYNIL